MLTVRSFFSDALNKLVNLPVGVPVTMLSRVVFPDSYLEHRRSHLPALVEELSGEQSFKRHTKVILDMYDAKGKPKPGVSHTHLGDSQTRDVPESLRVKNSSNAGSNSILLGSDDELDDIDYPFDPYSFNPPAQQSKSNGIQHIMLASDDEENEDGYYTGTSVRSDEDRLEPIVISDDEGDYASSSSSEHHIRRHITSQKNLKKRKR